jgi:invasion protein IalB
VIRAFGCSNLKRSRFRTMAAPGRAGVFWLQPGPIAGGSRGTFLRGDFMSGFSFGLVTRTFGFVLMAGAAMAQTAPRAPTPAPAAAPPAPPAATAPATSAPGAPADAPERTSAVFGDWTVQCVTRTPGNRICEMIQATQNQQQQPVSVLAIGRLTRTDPLRLVARVPVNALVAQPARLTLDGDQPLTLPFRHCSANPVGCFAEYELRDEAVLRRLRGRTPEQPGKLEFREPTGQEIGIPVSFRGFGAALEALQKEGG